MTIHKSAMGRNLWYVRDAFGVTVFRGTYDECQTFAEGKK